MGRARKGMKTPANVATEERRNKVAKLLVSGVSMAEMSRMFDVNKSTISRDVEYIRKQWVAENAASFEQLKADIVAGQKSVIRDAMTGWQKSLKDGGKTVTTVSVKDGETVRHETYEQAGDPRFLDVRSKAFERIANILLPKDMPTVNVHTHNYPIVPRTVTSRDELKQIEANREHHNGNGHHHNGNGSSH